MVAPIFVALLLSLLFYIVVPSQSIDFLYNVFNPTYKYRFNQTNLILDGFVTIILPSGVLELTNKSSTNTRSHAFYPQPIQLFIQNSSFVNSSNSFSTYFFFEIVPRDVNRAGYGLAFTLSPSQQFPRVKGDHYLGIFNSIKDGNPSHHVLAVEFDTVSGHKEAPDTPSNHIESAYINSMASVASELVSFHFSRIDIKEEVRLESGKPIHAWIEYDGGKGVMNVTIWPESRPKQVN